ncbi:MAG: hypothetical protein JNM56_16975 [Planctomycetia bacterium]|nr:hypothetical protein [Planctomycetia bacterium]
MRWITCLVGALALAGTARGAPETPLPTAKGTIVAIDWQTHRLTLHPSDGRTLVLYVHPEASWVQVGADAWKSLLDLKVGMTADVIYRTDGCQPRIMLLVSENDFF